VSGVTGNGDQPKVTEPPEKGAAGNAADAALRAAAAAEDTGSGCCAPAGRSSFSAAIPAVADVAAVAVTAAGSRHSIEQVIVPKQTFAMGDSQGDENKADGETPVHEVRLESFSIDATSVTNADFERFVAATDYRTEAEAWGFSAVFHLAIAAPEGDVMGAPPGTPWWRGVKGADWRHPGGRHSTIEGLSDHPAVHISWNDAVAYCAWAGRSLPTEAQWEAASRGGLAGARFPWGNDPYFDPSAFPPVSPQSGRSWRMNIWQGVFPTENTLQDGFLTTAPVRTFEPNAYGLWQTIGNVWEWCADWWSANYYRTSPREDPRGPSHGQARVMRGGSYLCHDSYCNRYRNAARSSNTPDSSMGNAGFRTVERWADDSLPSGGKTRASR
jgi:formylglycine-generating enzyme